MDQLVLGKILILLVKYSMPPHGVDSSTFIADVLAYDKKLAGPPPIPERHDALRVKGNTFTTRPAKKKYSLFGDMHYYANNLYYF